MQHSEFTSGTFWCSGRQWCCTDIGARTIAAIRIDRVDVGSNKPELLRTLDRAEAEACYSSGIPPWCDGGPGSSAGCLSQGTLRNLAGQPFNLPSWRVAVVQTNAGLFWRETAPHAAEYVTATSRQIDYLDGIVRHDRYAEIVFCCHQFLRCACLSRRRYRQPSKRSPSR